MELTESQLVAKLGEKVSNMCKSIGEVEEDGKNKFSDYDYISSNNLLGHIRMNLSPNRLAIFPNLEDIEDVSRVQEKNGKKVYWTKTTVKMKFEVIDTETGFMKIFTWTGSDQDTGGKSLGQAITECTKRFYFKLFQVSSKEDKDPDSNTGNMPVNDEGKPEVKNDIADRLKPKEERPTEKLREIITLPDYKSTIQALLKSESVLPSQLRSEDEDEAEKVVLMIEQAKGFEDSEKKEQKTIAENIETQPVDENGQYF